MVAGITAIQLFWSVCPQTGSFDAIPESSFAYNRKNVRNEPVSAELTPAASFSMFGGHSFQPTSRGASARLDVSDNLIMAQVELI
jgi:hypothetical protein